MGPGPMGPGHMAPRLSSKGPWAHGPKGPWAQGPVPGPGQGQKNKKQKWISHGALGGPYLASSRNLLLRELVDIRFGAVRGPIMRFPCLAPKWALGPNGPWAQMGSGTKRALGPNWPWALGPNEPWAQTGPGPKRDLGPGPGPCLKIPLIALPETIQKVPLKTPMISA